MSNNGRYVNEPSFTNPWIFPQLRNGSFIHLQGCRTVWWIRWVALIPIIRRACTNAIRHRRGTSQTTNHNELNDLHQIEVTILSTTTRMRFRSSKFEWMVTLIEAGSATIVLVTSYHPHLFGSRLCVKIIQLGNGAFLDSTVRYINFSGRAGLNECNTGIVQYRLHKSHSLLAHYVTGLALAIRKIARSLASCF